MTMNIVGLENKQILKKDLSYPPFVPTNKRF